MDFDILTNGAFYTGLVGGGIVALVISMFADWRFWQRRDEAARAEVTQLQDALDRTLDAKAASDKQATELREQLDRSEETRQALEQEREEVTAQRDGAVNELNSAKVRLRQMSGIEQENETLRSEKAAVEARLREWEGDPSADGDTRPQAVIALESALTVAQEQVDRLTEDKLTLRDRLAAAEEELATLSAQLDTAAEDADGSASLRRDLQSARLEVEKLHTSLAAATARGERITVVERENDALRSRLATIEEDLLTENNRLVAADVKIQELTDRLEEEALRAHQFEQRLAEIGTQPGNDENRRLRAQVDALLQEIAQLRAQEAQRIQQQTEAAAVPAPAQETIVMPPGALHVPIVDQQSVQRDRLDKISGIGKVFSRRLNDAGINSYAELAATTPEKLREIVDAKPWQGIEPEKWIADAARLADQSRAGDA